MSLGGLVGFGVLGVALLTAVSIAASASVYLLRDRLRRAGPAMERSAAAWALSGPVVLAFSVVVAMVIRGSGDVDHCIGHEHHAHFCFVHGGAWLERPWAVAITSACAVIVALRLWGVGSRRIHAAIAIAQVRRVADRGPHVRLVRSTRVFCFIAGWLRPEVYASSQAWDALSAEEREAVLAHERAHAAHGDLWLGIVIDVASVLAAPLAGGWLRARWADAAERMCDQRAAEHTDRETVASALVRMSRAAHVQHVPSGFTPRPDALARRVRAVLESGSAGRGLPPVAWCLAVAAISAVAVLATDLHHALETLLG
ncbi:MAG: M56 family metallopeptidase [Myxococcales bacterium]|nr:M56 family metallopeptidase [Myxococcales bacterium]